MKCSGSLPDSGILDKSATEPVLRERLEFEARELSFIGNNLMIRHTEVGKPAHPGGRAD
jgi:hypothetical protein